MALFEEQIAQKVAEKHGHKWTLTEFMREAYDKSKEELSEKWKKKYDLRTMKRWVQVFAAFGYLEPVNMNVYQMKVVKVPHLVSILKNVPQTHIA